MAGFKYLVKPCPQCTSCRFYKAELVHLGNQSTNAYECSTESNENSLGRKLAFRSDGSSSDGLFAEFKSGKQYGTTDNCPAFESK